MKIRIERQGDNMIVLKDYSNVREKGELSHVIAELELIKLELLELWDSWEDNSDNQNEDDGVEESETPTEED